MELARRKIVIIGAGIGGLAAALALKARGADVTVLEQSESISEVGAGLQISPNGVAVLRALGLEPGLMATSVRGQAVVLRDYRAGREVLRLDLAGLAPDQPYYFVHRADLIDLLADAARAAGVQVRLLQRVARAEQGEPARVYLDTGALVEADLVIGADGLHSRTRAALNGEENPFFTGQVAWRAVVPNTEGLPAEAQVYMGPGGHLVCYPLRGGELVNIVAIQERRQWAAEGWHHTDNPDNLRAAFSHYGGMVPDLLGRVETVGLWGLFRHPVAEHWQGGNLAILGDAAHPTLPFMAQGANMALEDAWVLAAILAATSDQAEALSRYQELRRDRASKVIAAANKNAVNYHLRFPPLRAAAHLGLSLAGRLAPERMLRRFDWIYGHDVTATVR